MLGGEGESAGADAAAKVAKGEAAAENAAPAEKK